MNYGYRRFRWFHLIIAVIVALVIYGIQAGPGLFRSWHLPTTFAGGNSNAGTLGNNARGILLTQRRLHRSLRKGAGQRHKCRLGASL